MSNKERNIEMDRNVTMLVEPNPRIIDKKIAVWAIDGPIKSEHIDRVIAKVYGDILSVEYKDKESRN